MSTQKKTLRRGGAKIMASLILLLGSLSYIMILDSINEGIILKALKEQKNKKSIILVSHRESTMAIADRIYKVDGGVMTEEA